MRMDVIERRAVNAEGTRARQHGDAEPAVRPGACERVAADEHVVAPSGLVASSRPQWTTAPASGRFAASVTVPVTHRPRGRRTTGSAPLSVTPRPCGRRRAALRAGDGRGSPRGHRAQRRRGRGRPCPSIASMSAGTVCGPRMAWSVAQKCGVRANAVGDDRDPGPGQRPIGVRVANLDFQGTAASRRTSTVRSTREGVAREARVGDAHPHVLATARHGKGRTRLRASVFTSKGQPGGAVGSPPRTGSATASPMRTTSTRTPAAGSPSGPRSRPAAAEPRQAAIRPRPDPRRGPGASRGPFPRPTPGPSPRGRGTTSRSPRARRARTAPRRLSSPFARTASRRPRSPGPNGRRAAPPRPHPAAGCRPRRGRSRRSCRATRVGAATSAGGLLSDT